MSPTTTRERILDAALSLASRKGADATSMRELALACDLNVAALYYHFPSKEDLLRAVIEERHYDLLMSLVEVPPPAAGTDVERLTALLVMLWQGASAEEDVWRLLLAEACHHNPDAQDAASALVQRFEEAATAWLSENFHELAVGTPRAARLVADFMFANMARVAIGAATDKMIAAHAADLAAVIAAP